MNQFGASIGGPIIKNRLFFFGNYEGYRDRIGSTFFGTVPTVNMKAGIYNERNRTVFDPLTTRADPANPAQNMRTPFPGNIVPSNRFDPVAAYITKNLYPDPTGRGLINNYAVSTKDPTRRDQFNTRVDYTTGKDAIFGRFSFNNTTLFRAKGVLNSGQLAGFGDDFVSDSRNFVLSDVHTFSPTTILEGRISWYRNYPFINNEAVGNDVNRRFGVQGVFPNEPLDASVTGFLNPISNPFAPEFDTANQYQYVLSLTKNIQSHTLKGGFEFSRLQLFEVAPRYPQGLYNFSGNFTEDPNAPIGTTGESFADFLLGYPISGQTIHGDTGGQLFRNLIHWYVNDIWRVNTHLTLDPGAAIRIRWKRDRQIQSHFEFRSRDRQTVDRRH